MARTDKLYDHPRSKKSGEVREAKKGDRRTMDKTIQDGRDKIEFKGEYESVGIEDREEGDADKITDRDHKGISDDTEDWKKGGRKGPVPGFKAVPKDEDRKPGDGYELWRRRRSEIPTS